jgi:signal transduction histidine kinase
VEYLGIAGAMRAFCQEFAQQQQLEVDFRCQDLGTPLPPETPLSLYRVLQEALQNAGKHSGERHFEVDLFEASQAIHLTVRDSGVGFDHKEAMRGRGLGLTSMQERIKLVEGKFSIESQPGRGTKIHALVPLTNHHFENDPQRKVS